MDSLLDELNESQKKAVLHKDGPLLVLAGAGVGKTRAIAHRVACLARGGIDPERILAITFTNKAAGEMRERIKSQLLTFSNQFSGEPFVRTFHSLGVYILRKSGKHIDIPQNFSILDKEDGLVVIKTAMQDLGIDPKQFPPQKIQAIISRQKGELGNVENYLNESGNEFFPSKVGLVWEKYEEALKKQKALDFDDLVSRAVLLFKNNKEIAEYYQNFWQYILVDEYQDTNKSQYELSKILAEGHKNICVIGDMDQSIYGWRGADFRNIINFEKDYPEHTAIIFEENYRSTQNILEAAAQVIEKNKLRKPKKLFSRKEKGAEISLFEAMNEQEEAEFAAHKIKELVREGIEPSEIAILFRANFQSRVFEESCLKHRIPYQMLGTQFYHRKEVKDVFAFIKSALNRDDLTSIKRIINVPPRGLGKVSILNFFAGKKLPAEAQKKVFNFLALLDSIKDKVEKEKASSVIRFVIRESGLEEFLENGSPDDKERMENLKELVSIATRYDNLNPQEGIEKMLIDSALASEQDSLDKKKESVRLMTAHSAKGLEFRVVFVVGMEEGLFPYAGPRDGAREKEEEERRLFYVAMTRAKEKLFLSFSVSRMIFGSRQLNMPSRFLSDIPQHLLKMEEFKPCFDEVIEYD